MNLEFAIRSASSCSRSCAAPAAPNTGGDTETLILQVVAKVQNQENAEADKLRAVIRKAIAMLEGTPRT